jgi:hypothetical protein
LSFLTKKKMHSEKTGTAFTTFNFLLYLRMDLRSSSVIQNTTLQRLVKEKHPSLLWPFVSYKEINVLSISLYGCSFPELRGTSKIIPTCQCTFPETREASEKNSNLIADFKLSGIHSFVDDDAGEISSEGDRKRVERREILDRFRPHQLEYRVAVALRHPQVEGIDAGSFHLNQQILKINRYNQWPVL